MNSEERDLIGGLFDRMQGMGPQPKDREADAFIQHAMRQTPDAAYMLVQSVLVQEHTLQQADARIQELEARVQELEDQLQPRQQAPSGGGGFLGGIFGGGRPSQPAPQPVSRGGFGSVPPIGSRPQPSAYNQSPPAGPWSGQANQGGFGQRGGPMEQPAAAQRSGGGFLKGALATAAGVAGGMVLADSLKGMFGGSSASASQADSGGGAAADDNDPGGSYDAAADDNDPGGSWGGDDTEA